MNANERNPAEKAAAVISMLGADSASQVFHYLSENEIEQISVELSRLPRLEQGELENIANEFYDCCVTEKVITEGGREYAKEVLERAFGQQQAAGLQVLHRRNPVLLPEHPPQMPCRTAQGRGQLLQALNAPAMFLQTLRRQDCQPAGGVHRRAAGRSLRDSAACLEPGRRDHRRAAGRQFRAA